MHDLSIQLHADSPLDFETSEKGTVAGVARAYPVTPALVEVRELATVLRNVGRGLWANRLDEFEEAHMVRLTIT